MNIPQDVINNLGSFASIISIPITIIIFLVDNNKRTRKAIEKCAEELCKIIIENEKLDIFKLEKIIESILNRSFLLGKKSVSSHDVLSESLLLIRESPFLSPTQKDGYQRKLMSFWSRNVTWLEPRKNAIKRFLVFVLTLFLTFIVIDYFSGGFALSIAKLISFSLILKVIAGIILTLFGIIITVFVFELINRDRNYGEKKLEKISTLLFNHLNSTQYFFDYEKKEGFSFSVRNKRQYFKKKVVDTGPQIISLRGYRIIYELECLELELYSFASNYIIKYRVEKVSMVNGGILFDVLYIELFKSDEKLSEIIKLIKIHPENASGRDDFSEKPYIETHFNKFNNLNNLITQNHTFEKVMVSVVDGDEDVKLLIDSSTLLPVQIIDKGRKWELMKKHHTTSDKT